MASSLSNTVGSVVEFICTGTDEILSGPSVLKCTTTGKWNGSVPTCVDENEISTSTVSSTTGSTTITPTASPAEIQVETVLIVLWVTGGLLLVTLVVLMTCILTSHKKRQRNRSERASPRGQGNPRHGGVNPTFSNYDEIWTWIPVLTDNDHCRNQNSASAIENSATQTNRELMRNLRLPSYNEAVSVSPREYRSSNERQNVSQRQNVSPGQTVTHSNVQRQSQGNVHANGNNRRNTTRLTNANRNSNNRERGSHIQNENNQTRCQIRVDTNTTVNSAEQHHYETIPADMTVQPNIRRNPENVTRVRVTTSSGSALQQARDLVNQSTAHDRRPQPSAPEYNNASGEPRTGPGESSSRDSNRRLAVHTNPSAELLRGTQVSRSQVHRSAQNCHRSSYDFRHSEASVFEYYGDGGRRGRSSIPSTYTVIHDPPPPYSVFREPSCQGRVTISDPTASRTSAPIAVTSFRTGLESQYF
ncbi:GATA zinc finger domain-containing protein 14-like [Mercenaria mercenaria]|uniref:GATA zinc finger domain-containing protein 14-like n=1 Tax=Mercenaria mercenaria TaxID=6596 RepID=UPI00234E6E6D|nr:GATA zinc finger domain-containing protein 14-like [Mercenaria mercenaria]